MDWISPLNAALAQISQLNVLDIRQQVYNSSG
jgi:hypothetical protein